MAREENHMCYGSLMAVKGSLSAAPCPVSHVLLIFAILICLNYIIFLKKKSFYSVAFCSTNASTIGTLTRDDFEELCF